MIIKKSQNLYFDDQTSGDCLLTPQRWCYCQWIKLLAPSQDDLSSIYEISLRILKMIALIPLTAMAYGVGLLGLAIKACMIHPKSTKAYQHNSLEIIPYRQILQIEYHNNQSLSQINNQQIVNKDYLKEITEDIFVYIATFLEKSKRLESRTVSKKFDSLMTLPIFSDEFATNLRLWGSYTNRSDPWNQIKAYMKLSKTLDGFLLYLARLIPGGPVAFDQIPYLELDDASLLQISDVSQPIIRGKDKKNFNFFAIRLLNEVDQIQYPLIFTKEIRTYQCTINSVTTIELASTPWIQEKNGLWEKDTLKVTSNDTDLSYILNLIQRSPYIQNSQRFNSPQYIKTLKII